MRGRRCEPYNARMRLKSSEEGILIERIRRIPPSFLRMTDGRVLMQNYRVKVTIRCRQCGERFVLKGKQGKGKIETGFRQCICNNEDDFEVETEPE